MKSVKGYGSLPINSNSFIIFIVYLILRPVFSFSSFRHRIPLLSYHEFLLTWPLTFFHWQNVKQGRKWKEGTWRCASGENKFYLFSNSTSGKLPNYHLHYTSKVSGHAWETEVQGQLFTGLLFWVGLFWRICLTNVVYKMYFIILILILSLSLLFILTFLVHLHLIYYASINCLVPHSLTCFKMLYFLYWQWIPWEEGKKWFYVLGSFTITSIT